jgi:hypothetical protein
MELRYLSKKLRHLQIKKERIGGGGTAQSPPWRLQGNGIFLQLNKRKINIISRSGEVDGVNTICDRKYFLL